MCCSAVIQQLVLMQMGTLQKRWMQNLSRRQRDNVYLNIRFWWFGWVHIIKCQAFLRPHYLVLFSIPAYFSSWSCSIMVPSRKAMMVHNSPQYRGLQMLKSLPEKDKKNTLLCILIVLFCILSNSHSSLISISSSSQTHLHISHRQSQVPPERGQCGRRRKIQTTWICVLY